MLQSIGDPRLDAAKNSIILSDAHKENLAASMSHLAQALDMIKTTTVSTRNTYTTQSYGGRRRGRGGQGGRGGRGRGNTRGGDLVEEVEAGTGAKEAKGPQPLTPMTQAGATLHLSGEV